MSLKEIEVEGVNWIELAHESGRLYAFLKKVMNIWILQ